MCQSPHSLIAGEHYSLFQLTAGLSPATGEHAGMWVTVNTVCLPTYAPPAPCQTPGNTWHLDKELRRQCQSVQPHYKNHCSCFYRVEVQRDATSPLSGFLVIDCSSSEWKHFWWCRGWPDDGSPAKSILGRWSETEVLCWKQSGQFPRWKNYSQDQCVWSLLGGLVYPHGCRDNVLD